MQSTKAENAVLLINIFENMRTYILYLTLLSIIFVNSCSSKYAIISEEYEDKKIVGETLGVVNLFNNPIIRNPEDIKEDIGDGNPKEVYLSFFKERIVHELLSSGSFKKVNYVNDIDKSLLRNTELIISDEQRMNILLPKNSLSIDSTVYNFILFIDSLIVSRNSGISKINTSTSPLSIYAYDNIHEQFQFVIWDNAVNKIVSYGIISEGVDGSFGVSKWQWETLNYQIIKKLLRFSPFPFRTAKVK